MMHSLLQKLVDLLNSLCLISICQHLRNQMIKVSEIKLKPVYLESCTPQFILLIINILDSSECSYELMSVVTHFGGAGGKFSLQ